jgi:hypothetical protein
MVAASAALVRQYFREGFHLAGMRLGTDMGMEPSAAFVKAVIVHSTEKVFAGNNLLCVRASQQLHDARP